MKGQCMIAHIVFFKCKDKADAAEIKKRLETLPPIIPQIIQYELGLNELESARAFHLALYSQFESYETLAIYQEHPAHQALLPFIREVSEVIHSVDYTLS
jgi:hypothetical protein